MSPVDRQAFLVQGASAGEIAPHFCKDFQVVQAAPDAWLILAIACDLKALHVQLTGAIVLAKLLADIAHIVQQGAAPSPIGCTIALRESLLVQRESAGELA